MKRQIRILMLGFATVTAALLGIPQEANAQGVVVDSNGVFIQDRYGNVRTTTWNRLLNPLSNIRMNERETIDGNGNVVGTEWDGADGQVHSNVTVQEPSTGTWATISQFRESSFPGARPINRPRPTGMQPPNRIYSPRGIPGPSRAIGNMPRPTVSPRSIALPTFPRTFRGMRTH